MIKEDFVSYEVALLLKEKGFDGECFAAYNGNGKLYEFNKEIDDNIPYWSDAPTLQMAMKWLREVHNLFIEVMVGENEGRIWYDFDVINIGEKDTIIGPIDDIIEVETYEQACEKAIMYCLKNLI